MEQLYKLPMGIQRLERANKDGQKIVSFRVQMNRQGVRFDQLHPTLDEALKALNAHRISIQLKPLLLEIDRQALADGLDSEQGKKFMADFMLSPNFEQYVKKYIAIYLDTKYLRILGKNISDLTAEEKYKKKNYTSTVSQFKRIVKVKVDNFKPISLDVISQGFNRQSAIFGKLKIEEITPNVINSYVKTRIQDGMRGQSIRKEIVLISLIFSKLRHLNSSLENVLSPVKDYDKSLLKIATPSKPKFFRFSKEGKKEFIEKIEQNKNPEFVNIVKLMLLTAMRRGEVVLLNWSQVHENFIQLTDTKTNPRPVYLTDEAKEFIKTIPRKANQNRLFTYTVGGFEASFHYHLSKFGLEHITAHKLRKNAISEFVEIAGASNSLIIAKLLGIRDVKGLEDEIKTMPSNGINSQAEALKMFGHTSSTITNNHYLKLNLPE